jgi:ribonuclease BN (tRNA processing enzyme)
VGQQTETYFPVRLSYLSADVQLHHIPTEAWFQIGQARVYALQMSHPGGCYAYRVEHDGQSLVYATDSEYEQIDGARTQVYIDFFGGADLLIFDAQYTLSDALDKTGWGHSSPIMGAELAHRAGVKRLALFHHDPLADDLAVTAGLKQAEAYLAKRGSDRQVVVASEGLEMEW